MEKVQNPGSETFIIGRLLAWARNLYDWVVQWADTKYSELALFCIAFAESSFFPIPPDILQIAMGVSIPKRSIRFAAISTVGSVAGGMFGYLIGAMIWGSTSAFFYRFIPGFTPEVFARVVELFQENAFWAIFTAGFTPIPYKIFTIASGVAEIPFWGFVGASVLGRGARFFAVGIVLRIFGAPVKVYIDKYFNLFTILFTLLLFVGLFMFKVVLR